MTSVIVLFQRLEEARGIRNLLVRNGFDVAQVCTQGSHALSIADDLINGIVVCGYKFSDMLYSEVKECLPPGFEMLLVASGSILANEDIEGIVALETPVKAHDLVDIVEVMVAEAERRKKKGRMTPKKRSEEEKQLIDEAKALLMDRNHMTEEEAHKYLQKCSMDSGTNLVETVQMVIRMMQDM